MDKYSGHRLVARLEPDNTFWTDSTIIDRTNAPPPLQPLRHQCAAVAYLSSELDRRLVDAELR